MDKKCNHIALFYKATQYAYEREYEKIITWLEDHFFMTKMFPLEYYQYADDFIYRMDVTTLSYGEILKLAYRSLLEGDDKQFLLDLRILAAKLNGNQRYTYYDRDQIMELLIEISEEQNYKMPEKEPQIIPEILLDTCKIYMPVGFEGMDLKEYRIGSTRSIYDRYPAVDQKILEKEYNTAINQGNIYHYIIEIDHYINREGNTTNKHQWIHLANLLSAHYATEKAPWSKDLSIDLLRVYNGLKDCCEPEEFEDILFKLVSGTLRIAFKKIMAANNSLPAYELINILNYIINIYEIENNSKYLEYILELVKVLEKETPERGISELKGWIAEHMETPGIKMNIY